MLMSIVKVVGLPCTGLQNGGDKELVNLLIMNGANVNLANEGGSTPLHWAAAFGLTEIAEILIANGANLNAVKCW